MNYEIFQGKETFNNIFLILICFLELSVFTKVNVKCVSFSLQSFVVVGKFGIP